MSKRANCTFKFCIQGNGRNETLVRQPLATNPDFSVVTGGAVSLNSPAMMTQVCLEPGWNQLIDPAAYLQSPMARSYYGLFAAAGASGAEPALPPSLTLAGSTMDVGVGLIPGAPLVLALPPGPVSLYVYNWGASPLVCDQWNW